MTSTVERPTAAGVRRAFMTQRDYCTAMDAPITARICAGLARGLSTASRTGARVLDWRGDPLADALPLRLVGGLHALALRAPSGAEDLVALFDGAIADDVAVDRIVSQALAGHDAALATWLDGPPQTNEPARSAALMLGVMMVASRHGRRVALAELGSSAGLNLLIDRIGYDLGGRRVGPADAPLLIVPDWRGPAPAAALIEPDIVAVRGVDIAPIDVADPVAVERLRAFIWADQPERRIRLDRAIAMIAAAPVDLAAGDAADWVEAVLGEPQRAGVTRIILHSIVWQYLGGARRARITAAIEAAGHAATDDRPIGWVMVEPDPPAAAPQLIVRSWPGHAEPVTLARVHAHGSWIAPL